MSEKQSEIVGLIPARIGSKSVADKNIRFLAGHPVVAYTIDSALQSKILSDVIVSTDSEIYAEIACYYGAGVPFLLPPEQPRHSSQYPSLPDVYDQNASLEIVWTRGVLKKRTIAGNVMMPFFTKDFEGFGVNNPLFRHLTRGLQRDYNNSYRYWRSKNI